MGGFAYAGSLVGGAPVKRRFLTGETMYVGQLVKAATTASIGGHVAVADIATDVREDTSNIIGICTGIVDGSSTYVTPVSGTAAYGQRTTYSTTQSTIKSYGPSEVEVTLIIPGVTLVRAPIYNTVWGTALTVLTETTGNAGGITITDASGTNDIADDLGTIYCRSGANRGLYRVITDITTVVTTVTVPFPNAIAAGDTFVQASCVLGYGGMDLTTAFDAIDGNNVMDDYYSVYYHDINLEESGKEFAIFSLWGGMVPEAA